MAALCSSDVETIDNDSRTLALFVEVTVSPDVEKETLPSIIIWPKSRFLLMIFPDAPEVLPETV